MNRSCLWQRAGRMLQASLLGSLAVAWCALAFAAPATGVLTAEIPGSPLPVALQNFARQTAIQIVYVSALADGRVSKGAMAGVPIRDALTNLLDDTGLRYEFLNARSVRLLPAARAVDSDDGSLENRVRRRMPDTSALPSLEEIIVSATKRDEPLHDVAISAMVLPQLVLDSADIRSLGDIAAHAPGMQFDLGSQFGAGIMSNIVVRGISADRGTAPTVGIYMDDVPIEAVRIALYKTQPITFDQARVEVLRGPQGTLFGSSAIGGAVRYVSNEASTTDSSRLYRGELTATAQGGIGAESGVILDGPLQQGRLGARASAWFRRDGGYVDRINPLNGQVMESDSNRSVSKVFRLGFVFEPDESLRMVPALHHQSVRLNDTPMVYADTPDSMVRSAPYHTSLLQNGKLLRQPYDDDFYLGSFKLQKRFSAVALTSITAWFDRHAATTVDQTNSACVNFFGDCGNPLGPAYPIRYDQAIPTYLSIRQRSFTQELRLASADATARLNWLAGVFYSHSSNHRVENTYQVTVPQEPGIHSDNFVAGSRIDGFFKVNYALTSQWSAGVGTRFGWHEGSFRSYDGGYANGNTSTSSSASPYKSGPTAPRFELSYRPSERNFYYASVARGSRAGGDAVRQQCGSAFSPARLEPDELWSYELGSKNQLFDRRLQLDASAYYVHWDGLHGHVYDACGSSYIVNAGLAISKGFDLAAEWNARRLSMRLALGHTDIRYSRTVVNSTGQIVVQRGTVVGGTPEVPAPWTGSLSARYRWPLPIGLDAYWNIEELYASRNKGPFTEDNLYAAYVVSGGAKADPAQARLNLQFGLSRPGLDFRLAVNNALNARPTLHATSDGGDSTLFYAYTLQPRSVSLSVTRRY